MNDIGKLLYQVVPKNMSFESALLSQDLHFDEKDTSRMENSRQKESLLAHQCARKALAKLGNEVDAITKGIAGNPLWPKGFTGSISHSKGFCMAVVGRDENYRSIGLDIELNGRIKPAAIERITHSIEKDFIGDDPGKGTLLFSLKEAFYKAQFALFEKPLGFKDVAFSIDEATNSASLVWVSDKLPIKPAQYNHWEFVYKTVGTHTVVVCWLKNKTNN